MFVCSLGLFDCVCSAASFVLLIDVRPGPPPKFIARSAAIPLRKFVLNFLDPLHVLGKYIALGIPRTHPRCAGQTLNPMFMFALGQRSGPTEQNPARAKEAANDNLEISAFY